MWKLCIYEDLECLEFPSLDRSYTLRFFNLFSVRRMEIESTCTRSREQLRQGGRLVIRVLTRHPILSATRVTEARKLAKRSN